LFIYFAQDIKKTPFLYIFGDAYFQNFIELEK
jgi:hypothetical protein